MTEPKFSAAPWGLENLGNGEFGIVVSGPHVFGYTAKIRTDAPDNDQCEELRANALLLVAARELYEVLDEILDYSGGADHATDDPYVMERAHLALAKARGEVQP
jgi:hypothetical protein